MAMSRTSRISKALTEAAVIVASILLAFSLEAWWSDRETRREVEADLRGIDSELVSNLRLIEFEIDLLNRVVLASDSLLALLEAHAEVPFVTVMDTLAQMARGPSPTLDAPTGAIDGLLASGRLAALRSPELRRRLAGLPSTVDEVTEDEAVSRQVAWQQLAPAVYSRADFNLGYVTTQYLGERRPGGRLVSRTSVEHPNHPEIRTALRIRSGYYVSAIVDIEKLREEILELRALIAQELGQEMG